MTEASETFLRVVRGTPTDEELAALVVVLSSLAAPAPVESPDASTGWAAYWRRQRRTPHPGPGVWRQSLR